MAILAIAVAPLIAYNVPPSATFFNEAAALIGWGCWLTWLAAVLPAGSPASGVPGSGSTRRPGDGFAVRPAALARCSRVSGLLALLIAFGLLFTTALVAPLWAALPWSLALSSAGFIAAAALAAAMGAAVNRAGLAAPMFRAFCIGLAVAGAASAVVGIVQVYAPQWADGDWIARSAIEGRAVGNLRQPNHLSSLLLWAIVAVAWLAEAQPRRHAARPAFALLALVLLFVVVLSGSRTGALSTGVLALWGALDRRLSPRARIGLLLAPIAYALMWAGAAEWADYSHQVFGGESRFSTSGDVSSSRFAIWSNTLSLIAAHPWAGVGFGEFNFAWTLTPFPHRPVAFFDNAHNLVLQFAAELGLPLAALVLALLAWALARAVVNAVRAGRNAADSEAALRYRDEGRVETVPRASPCAATAGLPPARAAVVMVLLIGVHSLLEYPLWYAYFLLPAAFAFGLCLGASPHVAADEAQAAAPPPRPATRPLLLAAMLLVLGGAVSLYDYFKVVVIFAPPANAAPLAERIAAGERSWFFAHHAAYAAVTSAERPADVMPAFASATHFLLDSRLLMAWARAFDEVGDTQRARYVAQRLQEFHNEQAADFFKPCAAPPKPGAKPPFQCLAPTRKLGFEDFR